MIKYLAALIIAGTVSVLGILEAADKEYKIAAYKELYADIQLIHPDKNQLCQQGAALVLIGDHEIADKHMQLEGECIREVVMNHYSK